ncbi:unnamed protein product, partial [Trichogramma brassicae]
MSPKRWWCNQHGQSAEQQQPSVRSPQYVPINGRHSAPPPPPVFGSHFRKCVAASWSRCRAVRIGNAIAIGVVPNIRRRKNSSFQSRQRRARPRHRGALFVRLRSDASPGGKATHLLRVSTRSSRSTPHPRNKHSERTPTGRERRTLDPVLVAGVITTGILKSARRWTCSPDSTNVWEIRSQGRWPKTAFSTPFQHLQYNQAYGYARDSKGAQPRSDRRSSGRAPSRDNGVHPKQSIHRDNDYNESARSFYVRGSIPRRPARPSPRSPSPSPVSRGRRTNRWHAPVPMSLVPGQPYLVRPSSVADLPRSLWMRRTANRKTTQPNANTDEEAAASRAKEQADGECFSAPTNPSRHSLKCKRAADGEAVAEEEAARSQRCSRGTSRRRYARAFPTGPPQEGRNRQGAMTTSRQAHDNRLNRAAQCHARINESSDVTFPPKSRNRRSSGTDTLIRECRGDIRSKRPPQPILWQQHNNKQVRNRRNRATNRDLPLLPEKSADSSHRSSVTSDIVFATALAKRF